MNFHKPVLPSAVPEYALWAIVGAMIAGILGYGIWVAVRRTADFGEVAIMIAAMSIGALPVIGGAIFLRSRRRKALRQMRDYDRLLANAPNWK